MLDRADDRAAHWRRVNILKTRVLRPSIIEHYIHSILSLQQVHSRWNNVFTVDVTIYLRLNSTKMRRLIFLFHTHDRNLFRKQQWTWYSLNTIQWSPNGILIIASSESFLNFKANSLNTSPHLSTRLLQSESKKIRKFITIQQRKTSSKLPKRCVLAKSWKNNIKIFTRAKANGEI